MIFLPFNQIVNHKKREKWIQPMSVYTWTTYFMEYLYNDLLNRNKAIPLDVAAFYNVVYLNVKRNSYRKYYGFVIG